jgi:hypothetical protein
MPSFDDLKSINTSLLAPSLDDFLFRRLPKILSLPRESVEWHLNPLCRGCPFRSDCEQRTIEDGELGTMPNISLAQVKTIRTLLGISRGFAPTESSLTDIEDLHLLLADVGRLNKIKVSYPSTLKKAKRILGVQRNSLVSPAVEAARTTTIQVGADTHFLSRESQRPSDYTASQFHLPTTGGHRRCHLAPHRPVVVKGRDRVFLRFCLLSRPIFPAGTRSRR